MRFQVNPAQAGSDGVFDSFRRGFGNALAMGRPQQQQGGVLDGQTFNALAQNGGPTQAAANALAGGGGDMASRIRAGLIQRGMPEHIADGFIMNMRDESGLRTDINEIAPLVPGSRGGFGLIQWTGPRRKNLEAFAAERGLPVSDLDTQMDFLMTELEGPEARAARSIMSAGTTGEAAAAIVNDFLRPAERHRASRVRRYLAGS